MKNLVEIKFTDENGNRVGYATHRFDSDIRAMQAWHEGNRLLKQLRNKEEDNADTTV